MDADRFDALSRSLIEAPSRRSALRLLAGSALGGALGWLGHEAAEAGKKKRKKRKKGEDKGGGGGSKKKKKKKNRNQEQPPPPEPCGPASCSSGTFCCDDARGICCADGSECCNIGPGTGSCCSPPNRCGKPWGNDAAPWECCPPERQWFTNTGLVRCCPTGTRSLGTGITSDDGPCCPEEKYCSQSLTGGACCPDLAPICTDRATERCCTEEGRCGDTCCAPPFSECCNGKCRHADLGPWTPCGDSCCLGGKSCCTNGGLAMCCDPGDVCPAPCGSLSIACCTPESFASGHCCDSDCGDNCGG
jgi:hypothetical protein